MKILHSIEQIKFNNDYKLQAVEFIISNHVLPRPVL